MKNHKEKLIEVYEESYNISNIEKLPEDLENYLKLVCGNINRSKGVYTVLVTLLTHKILSPEQDIRYFQNKMENGFSARTIDTKYITPTLKELKLPSMAESGWLTRSLEQPYPYTMKYKGGISGKGMKEAFLKIVDYAQNEEKFVIPILRIILNSAIYIREQNKVEIKKIETDDSIHISKIIDLLDTHFNYKYSTHGGSKLPALAFYSMYEILLSEISRFKDYELLPLGSHTASDRTSKSAGDIEVGKDGKIYEAVEIKLDKEIDITAARIAFEKIARFNTERYYILSYIGTKKEDVEDINALILEIRDTHGCQLIVNGLLRTLRYYLRLISSPDLFLNKYINLVINDKELKKIHKTKLEELLSNI